MAMLPSYASALNPIDATAQAIGEVGYAPMVELVRQSERIDTILLISSLANEAAAEEDGRRAGADHRNARQADPDDDLHDRLPGRDRDPGPRRHRLLHLDAELRPRDQGAGRLRRVPRAPRPTAAETSPPPVRRDEVGARCRYRARC